MVEAAVHLVVMPPESFQSFPTVHGINFNVAICWHKDQVWRAVVRDAQLDALAGVIVNCSIVDQGVAASQGVPKVEVLISSKAQKVEAMWGEAQAVDMAIMSCVNCWNTIMQMLQA